MSETSKNPAVSMPAATPLETASIRIPLIRRASPRFTAVTTQGPVHFPEDYKGKWVILSVTRRTSPRSAPRKLTTFATLMPQFDAINCKLLGLSLTVTIATLPGRGTILLKEKIKYKVHPAEA